MNRMGARFDRLRYWNPNKHIPIISTTINRCNSTYRLRYATKGARQQRIEVTMRPAHL